MNEVTTIVQPKSVLIDMANRYGMEPKPFEETVLAICMPAHSTRAQFAAFLLVAKEYNLNPLTKEIYAFPTRGGGIVPIVSIDGWISLVNSHKACDGFSFAWEQDADGNPISCTCTMYRKDRSHPVIITEYLSECIRSTDPWKMKHRMLRHKTMIQAARYAFGFSGIYDEDEGAKIAEAREIPDAREEPPEPPAPPAEDEDQSEMATGVIPEPGTGGVESEAVSKTTAADIFLAEIEEGLSTCTDAAEVENMFRMSDAEVELEGGDLDKALQLKKLALWRVNRPTEADGQSDMLAPFPGDLPR